MGLSVSRVFLFERVLLLSVLAGAITVDSVETLMNSLSGIFDLENDRNDDKCTQYLLYQT